jgi:hypothetical protein
MVLAVQERLVQVIAKPLPTTTVKSIARHLISARMLNLQNDDSFETRTKLAVKVDEFLLAAAGKGLVYVACSRSGCEGCARSHRCAGQRTE